MKTTIKILLAITLLTLFTSCEVEDYNQPSPTLDYVPEAKTFIMPEALKGNYKEHLGEVNKGTISITENTFVIESEMFTITVTLNSENALAEGCYLYITLEDGRIIKITNWIESGNRIYIVLLDSELEYELGNFDKL
jgi:hypothetical protein